MYRFTEHRVDSQKGVLIFFYHAGQSLPYSTVSVASSEGPKRRGRGLLSSLADSLDLDCAGVGAGNHLPNR